MPVTTTSMIQKKSKKKMIELLCQKICQRDFFKETPKDSWNVIFKIMEGCQGHYKKMNQMNFKNENGMIAMHDKSNVTILQNHYHEVFNQRVDVEETILEQMEQRMI